jgi:hypothetical protein
VHGVPNPNVRASDVLTGLHTHPTSVSVLYQPAGGGIAIADIDVSLTQDKSVSGCVGPLADRRVDLYWGRPPMATIAG